MEHKKLYFTQKRQTLANFVLAILQYRMFVTLKVQLDVNGSKWSLIAFIKYSEKKVEIKAP